MVNYVGLLGKGKEWFGKWQEVKAKVGRRMQKSCVRLEADVVVISTGLNPSFDYFVRPHLVNCGFQFEQIDAELVKANSVDWQGVRIVVLVRYLPKEWIAPLQEFRLQGGRVVYFMDDDLMDADAHSSLPVPYARKIRRLATDHLALIEEMCADFWVSSDYLSKKYSRWKPKVLTPRPNAKMLEENRFVKMVYHGSASHQAEFRWLVPVIEAVQAGGNLTWFEVFGDISVNRLYRSFPRVSVMHPMGWDTYLAYTSGVSREIGLAPLLPDPFNAARAPTKFFDFARMGAVGLYSDVAPYSDFIRDGIDGILLPNDPSAWVAAINALATDDHRRSIMARAARERALLLVTE